MNQKKAKRKKPTDRRVIEEYDLLSLKQKRYNASFNTAAWRLEKKRFNKKANMEYVR